MYPPDWSLRQGWIPTEDDSRQFNNSYSYGLWVPSISQEASESPEKLSWTDSEPASDLLDGSSWLTASLLKDTSDNQLEPLYECNGEPSTVSGEKEIRDEAVEDGDGKKRKLSTSVDPKASDTEEQRRMRRIIGDLEQFEKEQKLYGKQQLRAIEDGFA